MKIAIAGKGGVGKTTLAAALARRWAREGRSVIAVDADPASSLPGALGISPDRVPSPLVGMRDLIQERTGAREEGGGLMYALNPKVDDLPERFSILADGVRLLVLGTVEQGGKGCLCPEATVLKALMQHLLLRVPDDVVLDMEAGLEHIGRASATGVDAMLSVVEPGLRSVGTARRVADLARDIRIVRSAVVLNKVRDEVEEALLRKALVGLPVLGVLPYSAALARADLEGRSAEVDDPAFVDAVGRVDRELKRTVAGAVDAR